MSITLRDTIKETVRYHLTEEKGLAMGQCLTAVGWVGGTVPDHPNLIELSMADVAGGGFATGAALSGKRPIYIVRYQGFLWYNLITILNYASKSKELWNQPCPLFVRAISMEGHIGPVAGSNHISLAYRMPGVRIASPFTPKEYKEVWRDFMDHDDPYICSEHRHCYNLDDNDESCCLRYSEPDYILFTLSNTRFEARRAQTILSTNYDIKINIIPIVWIKPYRNILSNSWDLLKSKYGGIILDDDYVDGMARPIAHKLLTNINFKKPVYTLGLEQRSAGFSDETDNLAPDCKRIVRFIKTLRDIEVNK